MKNMRWIAAAVCLAAAPAGARPWPDSSTGIVVFADQLPNSLNDTQRWFAATKLAGTQKQLRDEIRAIRTYNTNFLCLHYQLAVGCGPEPFIDGNAWTSDWARVTTHSNWFLLNGQTQRVHQTAWNWDVMNVTYSSGTANTGFPQYWITTCLARIRSAEDDGVFADSLTVDGYGFGQCSPTHPWLEDIGECTANWVPALTNYGAHVRQAFETDGGGFLYLPNLGGLVTGWDPTDYGLGHGGMIEGFGFWMGGAPFDPDDWRLQMERALALVRSNKVVICQVNCDTGDYTNRMFATAAYLLIKGSRTYLNLLTTGDVALEYYPEYTIDLRGALSNAPPGLTNLWHRNWGVYRRTFANGIVLVNPGASPVNIASLGTNYLRARAAGGGEVDAGAGYGGSLSYASVSSLTMTAYSGEVLLLSTNPAAAATNALQVTGLSALHRSGQTFLTWREISTYTGEQYRLYRHTAPITPTNLAEASFLYQVPERSVRFYANYFYSNGSWVARHAARFVTTNDGAQLPVGTGLMVWTLATNEFGGGTTGTAYYAITAVDRAGVESADAFDGRNSLGPVAEGVADPLPVRIATYPPSGGGGRVHVYIQYMDLRSWNPTFHAPHGSNAYFGFSPATDPYVTNALQYAYDYTVVEPTCPSSGVALYAYLHRWETNTYRAIREDPQTNFACAYKIFPVDVSETWYFGFARDCDYRGGAVPAAGDEIVNYTEQRILRMIYDTIRNPPGAATVDTNRLYVWYHSMGACGALAMALRYPNVFAAAYAGQPMTDYGRSGDAGGRDWHSDIEWKWGAESLNLPVRNDGPGGWADHLRAYDGLGVWDWQNHQSQLVARVGDEIVPVGIDHGTNDPAIEWPTQGRPAYPAFNAARRCWGGIVTASAHVWSRFAGMPPALATNAAGVPFWGFAARRNETVPGLGNASDNSALPPDGPGGYNQSIQWSASWRSWDGAPTDETNLWQMSFRSTSGSSLTADVTPRRLQQFPKTPGARVLWRNLPVGSSTAVQIGQLAADGHGLITITNFAIGTGGNRLRIDLDSPVDSDGDGMPDYWEQAFGLTNAGDAILDADGDGVPNKDEYPAGTDPLTSGSVFRVTHISATGLSWRTTRGFGYRLSGSPSLTNWPAGGVVVTAAQDEASWPTSAPTNALRFLRVATPP